MLKKIKLSCQKLFVHGYCVYLYNTQWVLFINQNCKKSNKKTEKKREILNANPGNLHFKRHNAVGILSGLQMNGDSSKHGITQQWRDFPFTQKRAVLGICHQDTAMKILGNRDFWRVSANFWHISSPEIDFAWECTTFNFLQPLRTRNGNSLMQISQISVPTCKT